MWSEHCSYKSSKVWLQDPADHGAAGDLRPGRECRRRRYRRRRRGRLQDREPQPPLVHRALPGRGDRGRRHPARRLHDGRAADRDARIRCASAARTIRGPGTSWRASSPGSAATAIASACRRSAASASSTLPITATSWSTRCASGSPAPTASSIRPRPGRATRSIYVGAKTGRDGIHGATMASAEFGADAEREAPDRAGRRPVHREAADRGLPRTDGRATRSSRSRTWARPA